MYLESYFIKVIYNLLPKLQFLHFFSYIHPLLAIAYSFSKRLSIRIVIAIWSLAAFLLINYYNSLCISFLAVPITEPLIQSIHELQNNRHPEIRLVTNKNKNIEALLLVYRFTISQSIKQIDIDFPYTTRSVGRIRIAKRIG